MPRARAALVEDPTPTAVPKNAQAGVPAAAECPLPLPHAGWPLPPSFDRGLAHRALAVYSQLRSFSRLLHLAPFTAYAFMQALVLPMPCTLLAEVSWAMRHLRGGTGSKSWEAHIDLMRTDVLLAAPAASATRRGAPPPA